MILYLLVESWFLREEWSHLLTLLPKVRAIGCGNRELFHTRNLRFIIIFQLLYLPNRLKAEWTVRVVFAKTGVCLMDVSSENLLLVKEDKTHINPSAQLVAEAIATFQENNMKRVNDLFLEPLEVQVISWDDNDRHPPEVLQRTLLFGSLR